MNREWMHAQLVEFRELTNAFYLHETPNIAVKSELRRREVLIKKILTRLDPSLAAFDIDATNRRGPEYARNACDRAIGILDYQEKWEKNLASETPALQADQLHSWVWRAAATFWTSEHYRSAVLAAAQAINAYTQQKINDRSLADSELMNHVLRQQPKSGQTILRLPGDQTDTTVQSRNRAMRALAEGCFAGTRNPAAHEHGDDWPEQLALEYLATLSVLARWLDECEVQTAP